MAFQNNNNGYVPSIKAQTRLNAIMVIGIEHDYHHKWPIVVTCYSR